jgi:hypothetical protein
MMVRFSFDGALQTGSLTGSASELQCWSRISGASGTARTSITPSLARAEP